MSLPEPARIFFILILDGVLYASYVTPSESSDDSPNKYPTRAACCNNKGHSSDDNRCANDNTKNRRPCPVACRVSVVDRIVIPKTITVRPVRFQ